MRLFLTTATLLALAAVSVAAPADGYIHGTLTLRDGETRTGFLRWEGEEAFWNDLFHSRKRELPWTEHLDLEGMRKEREERYFATHGLIDRLIWSATEGREGIRFRRLFIMRFGDIARLDMPDDDDVLVTLRDGGRQLVGGYANDVSSDILVYNGDPEPETFDWDELVSIEFSPAPSDLQPYATRLYGTVRAGAAAWTGFVQWDKTECLSTDILDSDERDLEMGEIRAIARDPAGGSRVTLHGGETLHLTGSNDVDRGHRGVVVTTPDEGAVVVPWDRFDRVDFVDPPTTGPAYAEFDCRFLEGTVETTDGRRLSGRLVYDADEERTCDMLNGTREDRDYDIPFSLIAAIEPDDPGTCNVDLVGGRRLKLGDDHDTGQEHAGVLVLGPAGGDPVHVPWSGIRRIDFAP